MDTVKEAADSLLAKKKITQEEYDLIKESGAFTIRVLIQSGSGHRSICGTISPLDLRKLLQYASERVWKMGDGFMLFLNWSPFLWT